MFTEMFLSMNIFKITAQMVLKQDPRLLSFIPALST